MNKEILNIIILAGLFLTLFSIAEILYHRFKIKAELTRKLVHIGTGMLTLLFPVMLGDHWLVLLLCSSFACILILSIKFNLLKSINAIERESVGSVAYPISVYGCYLAFIYFNHQYIFYYLPILTLAVCDPIAALTGKKWPFGKYKTGSEYKTLMGSAMFFLSAFTLGIILIKLIDSQYEIITVIIKAISIAFISAITESLSRKGYDNITIPASVLAGLILTEKFF